MRSLFTFLVAFIPSYFSGTCSAIQTDHNSAYQVHAADTCADPRLAIVYAEAFSPSRTAHILAPIWVIVTTDTQGDDLQIQSEVFLAWQQPQESTIPFYQLLNPTINDFIYLPAVNGTPPSRSGYQLQGIQGHAYATQVCGSVPLLSAFQPTAGDHWYTTDASAHSLLISSGSGNNWVDDGTPFFVLPLNSGCGCSS